MQLKQMTEKSRAYRVAGIPLVIALNVDGEEGRVKAAEVMQELRWPFEWGSIENISLDALSAFQQGLFDLTVPLTVPLHFLISCLVCLVRWRLVIFQFWLLLPYITGGPDCHNVNININI